jgi:hypothetical protein
MKLQEDDDLRLQLNLAIGRKARKEDIVVLARDHPARVREWAQQQTSRPDLHGYDFGEDRRGVVGWYEPTKEYVAGHPIDASPPETRDELRDLLVKVLEQFKRLVEQQRGWELLWNSDGTEKDESAAQLVFLGIAQNYLRLFDVEIDREVELGRGPCDFKIARGTSCRMILEVKKVHNSKFWNGLADQLPSYLRSDDAPEGWFVAIQYRGTRGSRQRLLELPRMVTQAAERCGKDLRYPVIDGRSDPPSVSRIGS